MPAPSRDASERRIRALIDLGRVRAAHQEVLRLLAEDPNDPAMLELLGLCQIRLGEAWAAWKTLAEACVAAPDRPHPHYLRGFAAKEAGDLTQAIEGFRDALRLAPDEPVYLRALAELLVDRREHDEALGLARRAVAVAPEIASNHVTLGFVASAAGRLDVAAEEYRAAIRLDPNDATAWNNLGCVEMARGDRLSARERFREALRLDPRAERAQRNLSRVAPPARPHAIYNDFNSFLGEVLRDLRDAGRLGPPLKLVALVQAVGTPAVRAAITTRAEAAGPASRIGVAAGAAAAGVALRMLGPGASLVPIGLLAATAGVSWLVTAQRVTPLRRRYAEQVGEARRSWERLRRDWLEGRLPRPARDQGIDRLVEQLAVAIDREAVSDQDQEHDG
jgi:Flp pilus assembly protein TadD